MENGSWEQITDQSFWEKELLGRSETTFLQSRCFGEFQAALGNSVWFLGKKEGDRLVGQCLAIKQKSKIGSFFYVPGGPFIDNWERDFPTLVKLLLEIGRENSAAFVRFDPRIIGERQLKILQREGLRPAPYFTQPQCTLLLDLKQELEAIKKGFSESTRYNVGWVERQGVKVKVSQRPEEIKLFTELLTETATRHGFRLTSDINYYKEQFLNFYNQGKAKLYLTYGPADQEELLLAAAIVIYWGKTATYLHAASSSKAPKLRAPYLMQWKIITEAKEAGMEIYDFWGVARDSNLNDPWAGVTAFKQSFGGERLCYEKPFDLVINKKDYYFSVTGERIRKLIKKWR